MFFKREKYTPIFFIAVLEKYDNNPAHQNITSSYDEELHTPAVLTKYLSRDIKFLVAILEANKSHLPKDGELYKDIAEALRFAKYDLERAQNNLNGIHSKRKKAKNKKDINLESEWNAANDALQKCQTHFDRMESFKNWLDETEEEYLDKDTCKLLKSNIKTLQNLADKITHLTKKANLIYQKYKDFWGENQENIEEKLDSKVQKIDKKEIEKFEKITSSLVKLYHSLPVQHQFLDNFLQTVCLAMPTAKRLA
ncbi:TPA: hypothetical protein ACT9LS_002170 [Legionella pneumophila]|uniref:hypothetical protein n=1 Tax=Legionella pneumophila TaxID=446 RepID=UPI000770723B|nr:hypothetical protein [Legionella pneumophila]TIG87821.1 hypothetical protein DI110_01795 [Legionella pneumophila]CZG05956.1 Uncharacterised protein [Legionella pneumophila]STX83562.1 Uncharacterised protein [Legionella pneumophila]HAT1874868.1 hypothetical protein [Legionella pneumophila]HAT1989514.1 hypothetical protein [Legionella pneumophila]